MRLRTCLGIAVLGLGACTTLPELVRIEVDGNSVEVKRKPGLPPPPPAPVPPPPAADAPER